MWKLSMKACENTWKYMKIYENTWKYMSMYLNISMKTYLKMEEIECHRKKIWFDYVWREWHQKYKVWFKFGYVSINNISTPGFDCSSYSQSIILVFGYVYIVIVAPPVMFLDYFYLQKCMHRKLISYIFVIPTNYLNKDLLACRVLYPPP